MPTSTAAPPQRPPRPSPLRNVHPDHRFWRHVFRALSLVWLFLSWLLVGFVILGIGVGVLQSLVINGNTGLPDPSQVAIIKVIVADPLAADAVAGVLVLLALIARRAHFAHLGAQQRRTAGAALNLKRVDQLDPDVYVPRYVRAVYQARRDADSGAADDDLARATLRAAAEGAAGAPWGICVFGRPTQGKTRLAWEAMRATLPDW
ncbi:MAG TPA: hypothetical protein VIG30_10435, partial [Ktedonobacterales bacterium]